MEIQKLSRAPVEFTTRADNSADSPGVRRIALADADKR
jgi:hypothetical protein